MVAVDSADDAENSYVGYITLPIGPRSRLTSVWSGVQWSVATNKIKTKVLNSFGPVANARRVTCRWLIVLSSSFFSRKFVFPRFQLATPPPPGFHRFPKGNFYAL